MVIRKIISGGQTGADQAGLRAGKLLGLKTGGTAPYNWMTEEGPQKVLLSAYGLIAGPYDPKTYPIRTRLNVENSDGTVIFGNISSPGSKQTIGMCKYVVKPCIVNPTEFRLRKWARENSIEVLNVAGNRESRNLGIYKEVVELLLEAFGDE